jgi:hypothetical protein
MVDDVDYDRLGKADLTDEKKLNRPAGVLRTILKVFISKIDKNIRAQYNDIFLLKVLFLLLLIRF